MRGALFLLLLAFFFLFFSAALVACESVWRRVRVLFVLCSPVKPRYRYGPAQCSPSVVRVCTLKGSRAGYDATPLTLFFFFFFAIEDSTAQPKAFSSQSKPFPKPQRAVIATLGPACRDVETLKDMLEAGMSCARVDLTVRKGERKERDTKTRKKERGERIDARRCRLLFRSP